jgi:hypothetical protein
VQNSVITFQPLLALARLARAHFGHPMGLTRLVRWFIVALHVCSHVPHFHSAFLFDPFSTSVAFLSGSTYSPSSCAPLSAHHTARLLVGLNLH